ncbi:MAG: hypothetical protein V7K27_20005 [Nostoc sp.]|uniref:hypothetical protein n=1 Tax=Nostoc sp. TaxID=1180 RepID=UPI002FF5E2BE
MTTITPGTGGTLKSVKAENALVELVTFLKNAQTDLTINPNKFNYVTIDYNVNTGSVSISFNIPANSVITATGNLQIVGGEYLTNLGFIIGDNGTFKNTTAAGCLIEIASFIQSKESDIVANPNGNNYTNFNYDGDNAIFGGTATIPFTVSIDANGKPLINVTEYLL